MTKKRLSKLLPLTLVAMGIVAVILAFPHLMSAYYVEAGGRAIAEPGRAQVQLDKALRWDPDNAQAYRLLAKAYGEEDNWSAAIAALEEYTRLRPRNPLGHMQLAQAYEKARDLGPAGDSLNATIIEEWRRAGLSAQVLLIAGDTARESRTYDEAMAWYQRALLMEPELGDPWYHIGLAYASQKRWDEALDAFERALDSGQLQQVGHSDPYYQQGIIYQLRLEPPQMDKAFSAYRSAVDADDFSSRQDEAWAHTRLGQVIYEQQDDFGGAEREMLLALEMAPAERWLYVLTGDLYRRSGDKSRAQAMYEQALLVSPGFDTALQRLDALR